jgi:MFS family permease
MSTLNVAARYIALFLQASSYAGFIVFYSWISSSFPRPPAKRAVAIAIINAFSQLGNVAGSYVWDLEENGYRKSYGIVLSMFGTAIAGCWIVKMMLNRLNKQLAEAEVTAETDGASAAHGKVEIMNSPDEALRMRKGFRYLV